jgi:hypothetical protein
MRHTLTSSREKSMPHLSLALLDSRVTQSSDANAHGSHPSKLHCAARRQVYPASCADTAHEEQGKRY